jgi:hypothetical protein
MTGKPELPTRVLEIIRDTSRPRLVLREAADFGTTQAVPFVALSHCWGTGIPFCTTKSNLEHHKTGILLNKLPSTFLDTVAIVSRLGLRYIWIDSLCIVQDDREEWAREAAKMAKVYGDAHLVIGAARADSDMQGFLGLREQPESVKMPNTDGEQVILQLQPTEGRRWIINWEDPMVDEPLTQRAWCLQERFLANRMLLYGTHQAFWECNARRASEDGDEFYSDTYASPLDRILRTAKIASSIFARASHDMYDRESGITNHAGWHTLLESYTRRAITRDSDRLPALGGLRDRVGGASGDEYLYGIWKSACVEGLAWCGEAAALRPPRGYAAPSWSWASVAGPVAFPVYHWYDRAMWHSEMADFEALARYVDHGMKRVGRVRSGFVRLSGMLWPVVSVEPRQEQTPNVVLYTAQAAERSRFASRNIGVRYENEHEKVEFWIEGGFDTTEHGIDDLFVLFLVRWPVIIDFGFLDYRFGLLIKKDPGNTDYRRVGFVDGHLLRKVYSESHRRVLKSRNDPHAESFGVTAYPRPTSNDSAARRNDLAYDPLLEFEKTEIDLV